MEHLGPEFPSARFVDRSTDRDAPAESISAISSHREFLKNLVFRDLKLKYRGSVLGFLWSLLNPLAVVLAYTFAFKYILGSDKSDFWFFVLLGILAWTFFASAVTMSTGAIIESAGLVKAVKFPRAILPIATVCFNLAQYLLTALVFLPLMLLLRQEAPGWPVVLFPVFLALQVFLTMGFALALSALTTYFRDIRHLVEVGLQLLFWTTPVVYALDIVNEPWIRSIVQFSPMSPFITAYHQIFYDRVWPDVGIWTLCVAYAIGAFVGGMAIFGRLQDELGEQL